MKQRSKAQREVDEALNHQKYREIDAERDRQAGRVPQAPPKPLYVNGERAIVMPFSKKETPRQMLDRANELKVECDKIDRDKAAKDKDACDPRCGLSPEQWKQLSGRAKLELANKAAAARRAKKA